MPSGKGPLPKHWTPDIIYLTAPAYSRSLTQAHTSTLKTRPRDAKDIPSDTPRGPCPLVRITPITTPSHPACGQSGLFAAKDLKPGTFILQYIGEVHAPSSAEPPSTEPPSTEPAPTTISLPPSSSSPSPAAMVTVTAIQPPDPHATSNYDLSLDRYHGIGIDAATRGNEARFINDYRGVADRANAEFREVWDGRRCERGMGVWVLPEGKSARGKGRSKGIRRGEEIVVSYGRGFWGARRGEEG